jgi:NADH dehydrogenase
MDKPLPPRAQTAQQQAAFMVKAIKARLHGSPLPIFKYRDFGSLISLGGYGALGILFRGIKIDGLIAMLAYRLLHKMHLRALHGTCKVALETLAKAINQRTEPRIKLH